LEDCALGNYCEHFEQIDAHVRPQSEGCAECVAMGERWVHLRMCLSCGHVGCCDSSPQKHATQHHRATQHPIIRSFEPGERWTWCFVHEEAHLGTPPKAA
jgi:hypothetical protein